MGSAAVVHGLTALWHVGSSPTKHRTGVPCTGRETLNPLAKGATTMRSPCTATKSSPCLPQLEKAHVQQRRPSTAKKKKYSNIYINIYIKKVLQGDHLHSQAAQGALDTHLATSTLHVQPQRADSGSNVFSLPHT